MKQPVNEITIYDDDGDYWAYIAEQVGPVNGEAGIGAGKTPLSAYKAALKRLQRLTRECEREIGRLGG